MNLVDKKTTIDNNALVRNAKKFKFKEIYGFALTLINIINPYFWFKKIVINPSINLLLNKVFLVCYSIIGEETYNVYSKQAFVEEDSKLKELLNTIDKQSEKIKKEGLLVNQVSEEKIKKEKN